MKNDYLKHMIQHLERDAVFIRRNIEYFSDYKYNKEQIDKLSETLETIEQVLTFCKYVYYGRFDKRILEYFFHPSFEKTVDVKRFLESMFTARKNFPKKDDSE